MSSHLFRTRARVDVHNPGGGGLLPWLPRQGRLSPQMRQSVAAASPANRAGAAAASPLADRAGAATVRVLQQTCFDDRKIEPY